MLTHPYLKGVVFIAMPPPPASPEDFATYMEDLDVLTAALPPTLLIQSNGSDVITTDM